MQIVTAVFDYPGLNTYTRCLTALSNSLAATNPMATFRVLRLDPPAPIEGVYQGYVNNHTKLVAYATEVTVDQPTVLIDADTVVLRELSPLFAYVFDAAIAKRPGKQKSVYNGGVVLLKGTPEGQSFLRRWADADEVMLNNPDFHRRWHRKYRGMNQSSFGYLVETYPHLQRLRVFPTAVLNACEQEWSRVNQIKPYVLHVRKKLLAAAQSDRELKALSLKHRKAAAIWRDYELR